jgi:two-component system NarL family sensor kinase
MEAQEPIVHQDHSRTAEEKSAQLLRGNRDLAVLYAIASQLNHQVDVRSMLQTVLVQVTQLFGLETGWVWLMDEIQQPYVAAALALPPYLADHPGRMTGSCVCLDTFLAGPMADAANIDVLRCSRLKNAEREGDPTSLGLRFHASVPLYAGEVLIGVFNVASADWRSLSADELQLLHIVGDQIGMAVQRSQLSAERLDAATRIATIEERNRLAREIHDTLAQGLAAIALQLETADVLAEVKPARAHEAIRRALDLARTNLEEARRSVMDLRAAPLRNRSLAAALQTLASQTTGLPVAFLCKPADFPTLPARLEAGLYRIAQEALTNVVKHARAMQASIELLLEDNHVVLSVIDDGVGFAVEETLQRQANCCGQTTNRSFGLLGLSERVRLLGGVLTLESQPGTTLTVCIPLM